MSVSASWLRISPTALSFIIDPGADNEKSPRYRAISGHGHICLGQGKIGVDNGL
jgi:hypothetical protein